MQDNQGYSNIFKMALAQNQYQQQQPELHQTPNPTNTTRQLRWYCLAWDSTNSHDPFEWVGC